MIIAVRVLKRVAVRLRHSTGPLALAALIAAAGLGMRFALAESGPDCADAIVSYQFRKSAQTAHAAYDCLAEQPDSDDFFRQSLRPSVKAQINRQATFHGRGGSRIVFFVASTPQSDRVFVVYVDRDGKVVNVE
jgi:hypothetical protein